MPANSRLDLIRRLKGQAQNVGLRTSYGREYIYCYCKFKSHLFWAVVGMQPRRH